jgi:hypothetical protein
MLRLAWLLAALVPTSAWAGSFHFQSPEGWTDLSPGAPPENIAKAPPQFIADGRAAGFVFLAADLDHADDGFMENENVLVQRLGEPVSQAYVDGVMTEVQAEHTRRGTSKFQILEQGLATIADVTVGRVVSGFESDGIDIRQVAYLIPGGDSVAIMTFSTTAAAFAAYAPAFDAAARATRGVVQVPSKLQRVLASGGRGALIGAVIGLAVALVSLLRRKKAKAKA